jgi:hypothetical protein
VIVRALPRFCKVRFRRALPVRSACNPHLGTLGRPLVWRDALLLVDARLSRRRVGIAAPKGTAAASAFE